MFETKKNKYYSKETKFNFAGYKKKRAVKFYCSFKLIFNYYFEPLIDACAAAKRAIGTRNGEQLT